MNNEKLKQLLPTLAGQVHAIEIVAKAALMETHIRALVSVTLERSDNPHELGSFQHTAHDVAMSTLREWLDKSEDVFDAMPTSGKPPE